MGDTDTSSWRSKRFPQGPAGQPAGKSRSACCRVLGQGLGMGAAVVPLTLTIWSEMGWGGWSWWGPQPPRKTAPACGGGQREDPDWESGDRGLLQASHGSEGQAWGCSHGFLQQKFLWVPQPGPGPGRAWDRLQQLLLYLLLLLAGTALGFPKEYPSPLSAVNLKPKSRHVIWPDQSESSILSPQRACLVMGTLSKLHQ